MVITKSGEHNVIGGPDHSILLYSHDPTDPMFNISLSNVFNLIDLAHDDDMGSPNAPQTVAHSTYKSLAKNAEDYPTLYEYLLTNLTHIHSRSLLCAISPGCMFRPHHQYS